MSPFDQFTKIHVEYRTVAKRIAVILDPKERELEIFAELIKAYGDGYQTSYDDLKESMQLGAK